MIKNFTQFNEGINHLLVGPTDEEIWSNYMNGDLKGLLKTIPTSPEDFFNQMKDGCIEMDEDNNGIYYGKRGINLFYKYFNNMLWVSDKYILSFFKKIYELNYDETITIIKNQLLEDEEWSYLNPFNVFVQNDN